MCSKARALTLLEVVAAIALLSTLLVAVLAAHDRLARQSRRGELRLAAVDAADRLLTAWTATTPVVIPDVAGHFDTTPRLYWQVASVASPELLPYGVRIARLQVLDQDPRAGTDVAPLVDLEFLTTAAIPRGEQK